MNSILENMTGMNVLNDQTIANDLLIASKTGVRNLAYAITETASPQVRLMLKRHLDEAIDSHNKVFNYLENKDWYDVYNVDALLQQDLKTSQTILKHMD
ncbi:MAG TPA: spore coat protein [Bacillota bacterium]|nr:spore coat protein [Bacillota bacterium]